MSKQFYKTLIEIEVIHDEPWDSCTDMESISHRLEGGEFSYYILDVSPRKDDKRITHQQAANIISMHGNNPIDWDIDNSGKELTEQEIDEIEMQTAYENLTKFSNPLK